MNVFLIQWRNLVQMYLKCVHYNWSLTMAYLC